MPLSRKKSSSKSTATDLNGHFSLAVPAAATKLIFSSVGYISKEASIGNGPVSVSLTADMTGLSDVVIVGYGQQKKRIGYWSHFYHEQ